MFIYYIERLADEVWIVRQVAAAILTIKIDEQIAVYIPVGTRPR